MASRKRVYPEQSGSLFGATPAPVIAPAPVIPASSPKPVIAAVDSSELAERPKLRLVGALLEWDVLVEAAGDDAFYVTRTRDHGSTSSGMLFTRAQLERLVARANAALEVG
jgi:hypothetical protein